MKIRTQFRLTLFLFGVLLIVIAVFALTTSKQSEETKIQENIANRIAISAGDLSFYANDYVIYQEPYKRDLWLKAYSDFSNEAQRLKVDDLKQQILVQNIEKNKERMKEVFDSISLAVNNNIWSENDTLKMIETSWSRMAIQSQSLAGDASHLANLLHEETDQLNLMTFLLIWIIIGAFGAFLITIYVQTFRRTLKSIAKLQAGTSIIGSGDLEFKVEENSNDEIGELSSAFNQMTSNLKTVTASKSELEREIVERKRVEESLRNAEEVAVRRNRELEQLQVKLEEKAAEVEEYAVRMEEIADERAMKLKGAERLAAIGATAGMVGHDIRNPLQAITSDVYLAKSELQQLPESEEKRNAIESIEEIGENVDYINKIVQDLQDYARPLNPKTEISDLKQLVQNMFSKNGLPKNIEVNIEVADNARKIAADTYYLNRILYNLVTNSVQAMPQGGKLTIQSRKNAQNIIISVTDTGVGIPEDIQDYMFTLMFTANSKEQGFGLPVVKRMTESLGGLVTFKSQEGKGTTFEILLPQPIS